MCCSFDCFNPKAPEHKYLEIPLNSSVRSSDEQIKKTISHECQACSAGTKVDIR